MLLSRACVLPQPIINPAAFAIGPSVPAGGMNKTLTSVSIPSVDGPKDNKQMAAFVRPWQMTTPITPGGAHTLVGDSSEFPGLDDTGVDRDSGEQDNGSTGESLPHIEEMFGDRCVARVCVLLVQLLHSPHHCQCARDLL